jgi:apolipoprotein N-acyltransferase
MLKRHYLLSIPLLLIAALSGYRMYALNQEEALWGHWPLVFYLSAWLAIVSALTRKTENLRWIGLSTLGGALLALGFPPLPFPFLMFVGWVPFLWMQSEMKDENGWRVFKYAYHGFIIWNILSTYWVGNSAFLAGLFAITANALLMSVPFVLFHYSRRYLPRLSYLILIAYWLSFEYVHLRWELTWPWLTLGNAFSRFPSWAQWYEYTGVFGGSLWVLVVNILLWQRKWIAAAAAILIPLGVSLTMYYMYQEQGGEPVEVVVVQPNYEPHYEKNGSSDSEQLGRFLALADSALGPETRYVIFPETSFGPIRDKDLGLEPVTGRIKSWVNRHPGMSLITGLTVYRVFEPGEAHTRNARELVRGGKTVFHYESYNAATQFDAGGTEYPIYKKSKLVPGAETMPYSQYLFFLKPIMEKLDGSTAGLGTQPRRSNLVSPQGLSAAPIICYESVFGEFHAGYVRAGAQFGAIVTNDGWWDDTPGHRQHLHYASLRAIETRRDIARSANTGISAFINQRGDILQPTRYGEAAAVRGSVRPSDRITFYVQWGDLIGRISLFLSLIFLLNFIAKSLTNRVS